MNNFDKVFTPENIQLLIRGAGYSLLIAIVSLIVGTILGVFISVLRLSKNKIVNGIARVYVDVIRGTPMLLQVSFFYLGFPQVYQLITGNHLSVNALWAGIIAISINSGAYSSELIRGSIESIDRGQWEAGKSLGLKHSLILQKIILPQAFKRMVPPLVNEFIVLIKDSSLLSTIGVIDLMKAQSIVSTSTYTYMAPLMGAAVIYLIMTLVISHFATRIERRLKESD